MGKFLGYGYIRDKYEVVLPKEVREFLKLKPHEYIILLNEHGQVVMKRGDSEIKIVEENQKK